MSQVATIGGDLVVQGTVYLTGIALPASSVSDAQITATAGVQATKLQHQYAKHYAQESATAAVSEAKVVHVAYGQSGSVIAVKAGAVVACVGGATVTVNVLKNGTTIMSAVLTLDNTVTAYTLVNGAISGASYVPGDVFEVKTVATVGGGTLAKGVFAELILRENAS